MGRLVLAGASLLIGACQAATDYPPHWPKDWASAGPGAGELVVEYWLTDNCDVKVSIQKMPNVPVSLDEATLLLKRTLVVEGEDVSDEAQINAAREVVGQYPIPEGRVLTADEYQLIRGKIREAGPWPRYRAVGTHLAKSIRCEFDLGGSFVRAYWVEAESGGIEDIESPLSDLQRFKATYSVEN